MSLVRMTLISTETYKYESLFFGITELETWSVFLFFHVNTHKSLTDDTF